MQNKLAELADYLGLKYNQLADYKNANTPRNTRQKVSHGKDTQCNPYLFLGLGFPQKARM
jgi:hypothetical protein